MMAIEPFLAGLAAAGPLEKRPVVTISYAQSLDGSIALHRGKAMALSGPSSLALTHRLRAAHDAVLVGIGTVVADNPRLTTRLVKGSDARPVVIDTHLRFPVGAALMEHPLRPWIATGPEVNSVKRMALEDSGALVLRMPYDGSGRVDLPALLAELRRRGVRRLMVEGGASVITSFLNGRWADYLLVTISPHLVGGLSALTRPLATTEVEVPSLLHPQGMQMGTDWVIWGGLSGEAWPAPAYLMER